MHEFDTHASHIKMIIHATCLYASAHKSEKEWKKKKEKRKNSERKIYLSI